MLKLPGPFGLTPLSPGKSLVAFQQSYTLSEGQGAQTIVD